MCASLAAFTPIRNGKGKVVLSIPVAVRSKALICSRLIAGVAVWNPAKGIDICLLWASCAV